MHKRIGVVTCTMMPYLARIIVVHDQWIIQLVVCVGDVVASAI